VCRQRHQIILTFFHVACSFDISLYITKHFALDAAAQKAEPGHGLKVAGSTGERQQEDGIGIVLTTDKDEETVRNERLREAETKKAQNIMPLWHLRSTITNDLTALGIKENAQNATAPDQQVAGPSNLDDSLKGLGKVVRAKDQVAADEDEVDEEVKPGAAEGTEADCKTVPPPFRFPNQPLKLFFSSDYDQYYASLAASAAPSPPPSSSMMGPEFSSAAAAAAAALGDDFFEDEDRKPNIEYLDSLNEHNKRSRSAENEGGDAERKQARVGLLVDGGGGWGQGQENGGEHLPMNGVEGGSGVDAGDVLAEEDPIVYGLFFFSLSPGTLFLMSYSINLHFSGWQTNADLPGWGGAPRLDDGRRICNLL
jgi:transcription initiation factor TFIIE subunit alpha